MDTNGDIPISAEHIVVLVAAVGMAIYEGGWYSVAVIGGLSIAGALVSLALRFLRSREGDLSITKPTHNTKSK